MGAFVLYNKKAGNSTFRMASVNGPFLSSFLLLILHLLPVFQEFLNADVGEGVLDEF